MREYRSTSISFTISVLLIATVMSFGQVAWAQYSVVLSEFANPAAKLTQIEAGINDSGSIVGRYRLESGEYHGFLYSGGVFTTIAVPGAAYTFPVGINDSGSIVGAWSD